MTQIGCHYLEIFNVHGILSLDILFCQITMFIKVRVAFDLGFRLEFRQKIGTVGMSNINMNPI